MNCLKSYTLPLKADDIYKQTPMTDLRYFPSVTFRFSFVITWEHYRLIYNDQLVTLQEHHFFILFSLRLSVEIKTKIVAGKPINFVRLRIELGRNHFRENTLSMEIWNDASVYIFMTNVRLCFLFFDYGKVDREGILKFSNLHQTDQSVEA